MHRLEPARLVRVRLQLGAQAGDVVVHRARRRERGIAPDRVEKRSRVTGSPSASAISRSMENFCAVR